MACDTEKLGLIIGNLLSNACRFTRPGNRITVRVRRQQEAVFVTISDRGLGIPADIQPRVFEAYFSYDHGGSPFAGNGLGLTIARSAAALMGGTLALTSTPGRGTTVICTIPINDSSNAPPAVFSTAADYVSNRFARRSVGQHRLPAVSAVKCACFPLHQETGLFLFVSILCRLTFRPRRCIITVISG